MKTKEDARCGDCAALGACEIIPTERHSAVCVECQSMEEIETSDPLVPPIETYRARLVEVCKEMIHAHKIKSLRVEIETVVITKRTEKGEESERALKVLLEIS